MLKDLLQNQTKHRTRKTSEEGKKIRLRNMIHRMIHNQVDMATIQNSIGLSHASVMQLLYDPSENNSTF